MSETPFDLYYAEYDAWFEKNQYAYLSELKLVKSLVPAIGSGLEIGIGTGRFAEPLNIKNGIDPAKKMVEICEKKGIHVLQAKAEKIPFKDSSFDYALFVTSICFVDDINKTLQEISRILKPNGSIIIGFVDKNSVLGQQYLKKKTKSKFYKHATFFSTEEVLSLLENNKYNNIVIKQTLFKAIEIMTEVDEIDEGYGNGSFIGISASKP